MHCGSVVQKQSFQRNKRIIVTFDKPVRTIVLWMQVASYGASVVALFTAIARVIWK
ncbi:MAG: hypothetical protein K2N73_11620 [Lachnospiraceae bacterium]|nr:hypothetical protein [Lachnospiraceae bacterium]